jgi:hypothetical protein
MRSLPRMIFLLLELGRTLVEDALTSGDTLIGLSGFRT